MTRNRFMGLVGGLVSCAVLAAGVLGSAAVQADDADMARLRSSSISEYRLGANDRVRVTVFGEEDLSGEFQVDSTGSVSLPLIGDVKAADLTLRDLETRLEERYADGYLIEPRVSAEVINYRPFFITGEVSEPGQYPFEPGMTILKAVTTAGGYTPRANQRRVMLLRRDVNDKEVAVRANTTDVQVMPGDVIRVPERIF